ncbi:MAG: hypothetical protein RIR17_751 [Planctomycetota bacterium]|jgi:hypothetical protein
MNWPLFGKWQPDTFVTNDKYHPVAKGYRGDLLFGAGITGPLF